MERTGCDLRSSMPLALQVAYSIERVKATVPRLLALAQGGTAVGTGLNAKKGFAEGFAKAVADDTGAKRCLPLRTRQPVVSSAAPGAADARLHTSDKADRLAHA